ncbi:hypothetical protein AgCh_010018 [Apium graveolens]
MTQTPDPGVEAVTVGIRATDPKIKNVQCFKCGRKGHYAPECNPENPGVIRYHCGKVGHITRSCGMVTQAHQGRSGVDSEKSSSSSGWTKKEDGFASKEYRYRSRIVGIDKIFTLEEIG